MRALVVYESMFGNTKKIASAIADELGCAAVPVKEATQAQLAAVDLVVVGGPTHAWGMSRPSTRKAAAEQAAKPGSGLTLEPDATGTGLREWLTAHAGQLPAAVAFDTRIKMPAMISGRASRRIAAVLRRSHVRQPVAPQSFLVSKANQLQPGELDRAAGWGRQLASHLVQP